MYGSGSFRRRYLVFRKRDTVKSMFSDTLIKLNGLFCVLAAIRDVVNTLQVHCFPPLDSSSAEMTPRAI